MGVSSVKFGTKDNMWKGIDRSVSSNDANPGSAQIFKDMEIDPDGQLTRRREYDTLYDNRPSQFEHTTDDDGVVGDQQVIAPTSSDGMYRSHRRKMIVVGNDSGVESVFTGYVIRTDSGSTHTLYLYRGERSGDDIVWPAKAGGSSEELLVARITPTGDNALSWIEFDLVINEAKDTIYVATCEHRDQAGTNDTIVKLRSITDIYPGDNDASFSNATVTIEEASIEDDINIARDIALEIDEADRMFMFWRKTGSSAFIDIRYSGSSDWTDIDTHTLDSLGNAYALCAARDTSITLSGNIYLIFVSELGGSNSLYRMLFQYDALSGGNLVTTTGTQTLIASGISISGGIIAIDGDGSIHYCYNSTAFIVTHKFLDTKAVVTDLLGTTSFDFTVKDGFVTVFFSRTGINELIYKNVRITDATDENYNNGDFYGREIVRHDSNEYEVHMYFGCYREYEQNTSKRLSYLIGESATANVTLRYLHSDKGLFDDDFDGSVTEASSYQVAIKELKEPLVRGASGAMSQILIAQCDDNRLYKRGDYHWDLLEGQRNEYNTGDVWVTEYQDGRGTIGALNGIVRVNAGNGTANQNARYGYVDRYFGNNEASNRFTGYVSHLARLDPFGAGTNTSAIRLTAMAMPLMVDGYVSFEGRAGNAFTNGYINFYLGVTIEYDNSQESQLEMVDDGALFTVGRRGGMSDHLNLVQVMELRNWTHQTSPLNRRITAINIYFGEVLSDRALILGSGNRFVTYKKIKRILVSADASSGESPFTGTDPEDDIKGSKTWTYNSATKLFKMSTYIDYDMYLNMDAGGTIQQNIGNTLYKYESAGSGTEIYTKETFIPEGYKHSIEVSNELYVGNVRLAGVTRINRLMKSARVRKSVVNPDQLSGDLPTIHNLSGEILGMSKIGEDIMVVATDNQLYIYDCSGGYPRQIDTVTNVGTNAPRSITSIAEGSLGKIMKGVAFKDVQGNIRVADGYGSQIISDRIESDYNGTNQGIINLDSVDAEYLYLPNYRLFIITYDTKIFVLDFRLAEPQYYYWFFDDGIKAACVGVDGEMFFTDNDQVYVWPQAGTVDTPDPTWRSQNIALKPDERAVLRKVFMDYILTTSDASTLQPVVYFDRGSAADTTNSLAVSSKQTRGMTGFKYAADGSGNRPNAKREFALGFDVNNSNDCTKLEVDMFDATMTIRKRRMQ